MVRIFDIVSALVRVFDDAFCVIAPFGSSAFRYTE
jgi:hypothetical protein